MIGCAAAANFFGGYARSHAQFLEARLSMPHAVEVDLLVFVAGKAEHFDRQEFQRAEEFAAALEEQTGVGAGEFDENFRALPVPIVSNRRVDHNAVFQLEPAVFDDAAE